MTKAVFPGSFDPFTLGHLDILRRAARLFPALTVGVGTDPAKDAAGRFPVAERVAAITELVEQEGLAVEVVSFSGLLVDFARERGIGVVVRGVRSGTDLDAESAMAFTNRTQVADLEIVLLPAAPEWSFLTARLVRQIAAAGGDLGPLVPLPVARRYRAWSSQGSH